MLNAYSVRCQCCKKLLCCDRLYPSAQIVNKDLHAAYAELKEILKTDLAIVKARKESSGSLVMPAVAIAAVAVLAFYFLRS